MTMDELLDQLTYQKQHDYRPLVRVSWRPLPHRIVDLEPDTDQVRVVAVGDDYRIWVHVSDLTIYEEDYPDGD